MKSEMFIISYKNTHFLTLFGDLSRPFGSNKEHVFFIMYTITIDYTRLLD